MPTYTTSFRISSNTCQLVDCSRLRVRMYIYLYGRFPRRPIRTPRLLQSVRGLFDDGVTVTHFILSGFLAMGECVVSWSFFRLLDLLAGATGYIILIASKSAALSYFAVYVRPFRHFLHTGYTDSVAARR